LQCRPFAIENSETHGDENGFIQVNHWTVLGAELSKPLHQTSDVAGFAGRQLRNPML